jgi:putative salt-induced outer membrane protein YdiY
LVKDWLVPLSLVVTIISVGFGVRTSLKNYDDKAKAEEQLAQSRNIDMQLNLVDQYVKIAASVNGRNDSFLSEAAVEEAFKNNMFNLRIRKRPVTSETYLKILRC